MEISEPCNLRCPVCYAESGSQTGRHLSLAEIDAMLDSVVANEGEPDVLQISCGEPTLHPEFFAVLNACRRRPIRHLMISTNGLRIAQDADFVARLAQYRPGLEVYLQFESQRDHELLALRGAQRAETHRRALAAAAVSTTLVMTVRRGINDHEIGDVIRHALTWRCVRGVTLQPVSEVGRVEPAATGPRLTVSGLRRAIAEQSDIFAREEIVPVPCNPDTLAMAYALKIGERIEPLTRWLTPDDLLAGPRSTIVFERDESARERLFRLFATNLSPSAQAACLPELLCCLPRVEAPQFGYENVFRVLIVQFMDLDNLDLRVLNKSCVHFVRPDGRMIPFEAYKLFYRGGGGAAAQGLNDLTAGSRCVRTPKILVSINTTGGNRPGAAGCSFNDAAT